MIAVSYYSKREWNHAFVWLLVLLFVSSTQLVQAQSRTSQAQDVLQPTRISAEAQARMAESIARFRENKGVTSGKSPAQQQALQGLQQRLQTFAAVTSYGNAYFDTQAGDDFSFPEDTHDFCRAYFGSDAVPSDYYLNASLDPDQSLAVTLTWDTPADYDLYLFDLDGFPVGDLDPDADFDGSNGTDAQNASTPVAGLVEEAMITHTRAAAGNEFVIVVDRFRGTPSNALSIAVEGNDDLFAVLEYVADESFTSVNALTNTDVGLLTNGTILNLDDLGARPNYNVRFNTDACAESIVFTLVNNDTGESTEFTDSDLPYALFGDTDGDYNAGDLADGTYTLIATPFSEDEGAGVSADPQEVTFSVSSVVSPPIESYSLIDAAGDAAIAGFDPIAEGAVIDLVALYAQGFDFDELNLRANVNGASGPIEQVTSDLDITLLSGVIETVNTVDDGADYSVYGDDNAGDFVNAELPLGSYTLTGVAQVAGAASTPLVLNFTVIGPRIGSFTLVDAESEQDIAGFDPIVEGAVINVNTLSADSVNFRANPIDYIKRPTDADSDPDPRVIDSVVLSLVSENFTRTQTESTRPYALFGDPAAGDLADDEADYNAWPSIQNGNMVLTGTPFGQNGGAGTVYGALTVNFSIENAAAGRADLPDTKPALLPNYPNPFNPVTAIRFSLPESVPVKLEVFDMLGRSVMVLVDATLDSGFHEVKFEAGELSSGMYLYRLETPGVVRTRPMTLLK